MTPNAFIADFQKVHTDLLNLINSFGKAVESANLSQAKEFLNEINNITNAHFNFEETYLYPRLRRLVIEMTERLRNEQEAMRDFMMQATTLLKRTKLSKNEVATILGMTPRLSKLFNDCNKLISLAENFRDEDKEDLSRRFKECSKTKSAVCV